MDRRIQYILSFLIFVILFAFGCWHSFQGIDLTDEGMYISTAMRYALGDVPLKDEIMNLTRMFDVIVSPIFMLLPNISLFQIRFIGNALHMASAVGFFLVLSRYGPPILVAVLCGTIYLLNNSYGIQTLSYNSLSSDLSLIALTLWITAMRQNHSLRRALLAVGSGVLITLAVMSYFTYALIIIIPALVLLIGLRDRAKSRAINVSALIIIGTMLILIISIIMAAAIAGLIPGWIRDVIEITRTNELRGIGPFRKLLRLAHEISHLLPRDMLLLAALAIGLGPLMYLDENKREVPSLVRYFIPLVMFCIFSIVILEKTNLIVLVFSFLLSLIVLLINNRSVLTMPPFWAYMSNILIGWGLVSSAVYCVSSDGGLRSGLFGVMPIFVASMLSLYHNIQQDTYSEKQTVLSMRTQNIIILSVACAFFVGGIRYNYQSIYRDLDVGQLTATFTHPKLKGVHSTPQKVKAIEELLQYLDGRVVEKDYFLAYNYIPLLYYLTHTRPVYGVTWARDDWPLPLRELLISRMLSKKQFPTYCVRMLTFPEGAWDTPLVYDPKSPLDIFVKQHYMLEKVIYPFEIWHRAL